MGKPISSWSVCRPDVNLDLKLPMKRQKGHAGKGLSLCEVTATLEQKISLLHLERTSGNYVYYISWFFRCPGEAHPAHFRVDLIIVTKPSGERFSIGFS